MQAIITYQSVFLWYVTIALTSVGSDFLKYSTGKTIPTKNNKVLSTEQHFYCSKCPDEMYYEDLVGETDELRKELSTKTNMTKIRTC